MKEKASKLATTFSPIKLSLACTPEYNDFWHLCSEEVYTPRPPRILLSD